MKSAKVRKIIEKLSPVIAIAVFFAVWAIVAKVTGIEMIVPKPKSVVVDFFKLLGAGSFYSALFSTLLRTLLSFVISFIFAIVLAGLSYFLPLLYKLLSPIIIIIRSTPTMSIILIVIIWFTSFYSPVVITSLIIFPLLFEGFYSALMGIPKGFKHLTKIYDIKPKDSITKLYIPAILPSVFSFSKSTVSLAIKVMIASEVLAQTKISLGNFMQISRIYLNTSELLAYTIAAIILSFILEFAVDLLKRVVIVWQK